jgi:hypothetical protein
LSFCPIVRSSVTLQPSDGKKWTSETGHCNARPACVDFLISAKGLIDSISMSPKPLVPAATHVKSCRALSTGLRTCTALFRGRAGLAMGTFPNGVPPPVSYSCRLCALLTVLGFWHKRT